MKEIDRYLGLGDSMSSDDFPGKGKGAISLFYRNHPDTTEFNGQDVISLNPRCSLYNLARNGYTSGDVVNLLRKLQLDARQGTTMVTLTVGGNDLLQFLLHKDYSPEKMFQNYENNLHNIIDLLATKIRTFHLIIGTVYDPTRQMGLVVPQIVQKEELIKQLNERIFKLSDSTSIFIADSYTHFMEHATDKWFILPFEPSATGASEIRRVFWDGLQRIEESTK